MEPLAVLTLLAHACLWGTLLITAVGVVCRLAPRLPAGVRTWLWWLACAKLLLDVCVTAPINLPVLPAPVPTVQTASTPLMRHSASALPLVKAPAATNAAQAVESDTAAVPAVDAPRWPALLFAAWLGGILVSLAVALWQYAAVWRLGRGTVPVTLPEADLDALARQIGLRAAPRVLTGPGVKTPCLVGGFRPAILLPLGLEDALTPAELRLTLAHEMAHIKRCDLPLALVPLTARIVFFFHPLAWWATAEWAAAREEACDALALSATGLPRAAYGQLLLKLTAPAAAPPALGLSPGYAALRRRLLGLSQNQTTPRCARALALALPLLLPWRLSAALPQVEAAGNPASAATHYTVTALAEGADGTVSALNDSGQVALSVEGGGSAAGYVGDAQSLAPVGTLPKHRASLAYGLSNTGLSAGTSFNIPGHGRAFVWDGAPHRLGSLPGYPYSEARAVNAAGEVAGFSETGRADRLRAWVCRAFLHTQAGTNQDLGTLGGPYSAAYAVNDSGQVAGKADTETLGATHAFVWADGQMTDLGTLGGLNSVAYAVSGTGEVAGASETGRGVRHAFVYVSGELHDLPPLPSMTDSAAYTVNNHGEVAGVSQTSSSVKDKRATLWHNGRPIDLNALLPANSGWVLTEARAVNNRGQIVGTGLLHGKKRAFLLTPR